QIASTDADFEKLAGLYKKVFKTYPFPVFDPSYLKRTAQSHIMYGIIYNHKGELVAAASSEMDLPHKNAEMTDFATLPSQRGKGLASILLQYLEEQTRKSGISDFYTIARSRSFGMNRVFKNAGYKMTGKLVNNCCISGQLENMTIWCKSE
ncbi:MAG: putative beta-lysine N-acetyltransferase, partial [Vulcanimicrobiota bacterium]